MKIKASTAKKIPFKKEGTKPKAAAAPVAKSHSFFVDVWDVVRQIPRGRVTSYGAIAHFLGTRMSARMVGWAMNAGVHTDPAVPAQRVLNRNGMLTGRHHFSPEAPMQFLLEQDGLLVENDTVVDFDKYFWDPAVEIGMT